MVELSSREFCLQDKSERCLLLTAVHELKKFGKFAWLWNLNELFCLSFKLGSVSKILSKQLKVPIALLMWLNIRLAIYLDNILVMGKRLEEILINRYILIFLLQYVGSVINLKKSVLKPSYQIKKFRIKNRYPYYEFATNRGKDGKDDF